MEDVWIHLDVCLSVGYIEYEYAENDFYLFFTEI